jgi:hypothetical protein
LYFLLPEPNFIGARGSDQQRSIGARLRIDVARRHRLAQGAESGAPKPYRPQRDMVGRDIDGRDMDRRYTKQTT